MGTDTHPLVRESVEFHRRALEAELRVADDRLAAFERRHGLSSAEFERRFEGGNLGDDREWFDWMAELETAKLLRGKIDALRRLP